jgi:hypothetical protein
MIYSELSAHALGIVLLHCSECRWCNSWLDRIVVGLELLQNRVFVSLTLELALNRLIFLFVGDTERH